MIENQEYSSVEVGSNRSFGVVFAVVFAIIGTYPLLAGDPVRIWSLGVAGGFGLVTLVAPQVLRPLNSLWFKFGMLLGRIINPIVMFLIYVITILPIGLIMQALGKDLLRRRLEPEATSYWLERAPAGPEPDSLKEQF